MSISHINQTTLAERWDVCEGTLERWRIEGLGPVYIKLRGRVLYRLEDIESYERDCLRQSTSERVQLGDEL